MHMAVLQLLKVQSEYVDMTADKKNTSLCTDINTDSNRITTDLTRRSNDSFRTPTALTEMELEERLVCSPLNEWSASIATVNMSPEKCSDWTENVMSPTSFTETELEMIPINTLTVDPVLESAVLIEPLVTVFTAPVTADSQTMLHLAPPMGSSQNAKQMLQECPENTWSQAEETATVEPQLAVSTGSYSVLFQF